MNAVAGADCGLCCGRCVDSSSLQTCSRSEIKWRESRRPMQKGMIFNSSNENCLLSITEPGVLIAIPKPRILLIRQIALRKSILIEKNPLHRTGVCSIGDSGLARDPIAGSVISHTYKAVCNHREEQETPRYNGGHDSAKVAWPLGPQLRRGNATSAVADEEHGADDCSLCVAFGVGGC